VVYFYCQRIKKGRPQLRWRSGPLKRLNKLSGKNFNPCRLFLHILPIAYWVVVSTALIGQPVEPAVPQQPFGASSAQQGFGQGVGQGLSQPSTASPAQHGFGQPVVQGLTAPSVDAISAVATFGQDAVWAVAAQQLPGP
jgi:hypothetical protein